jgi:hypothetical protein
VPGCLWQSSAPPAFRRFLFQEIGIAVPPGYHGIGGAPDGHFVMVAVRARRARPATGDPELFCLAQPAIRKLLIEGDRATVVACPQGSVATSGHVLLRWVHRGILVAVSFHGINATNIDLDVAVAKHLIWIEPG